MPSKPLLLTLGLCCYGLSVFGEEKALGVAYVAAKVTSSVATVSKTPDSVKYGWNRILNGSVNLSQAYYDNWVKGGEDALNWTFLFEGSAMLDLPLHLWENKAKISYGQTKIGDLALRKTADEINLQSLYFYRLGLYVNPFTSINAQSQFTKGYTYTDTSKTEVSNFFDPAYIIEAVGAGYTPFNGFSSRLGFALKQTFSPDYGYADNKETAEVESFKNEPGIALNIEYALDFMDNLSYRSALDVFSNFKGADEMVANWDNSLTAKISKYVNVNFAFEARYDQSQNESRQIREALSLGISFLSL